MKWIFLSFIKFSYFFLFHIMSLISWLRNKFVIFSFTSFTSFHSQNLPLKLITSVAFEIYVLKFIVRFEYQELIKLILDTFINFNCSSDLLSETTFSSKILTFVMKFSSVYFSSLPSIAIIYLDHDQESFSFLDTLIQASVQIILFYLCEHPLFYWVTLRKFTLLLIRFLSYPLFDTFISFKLRWFVFTFIFTFYFPNVFFINFTPF